jgi:hypothetical protein
MSRRRKKYLNPLDWESVYQEKGWDAAGAPPPGARVPGLPQSEGWRNQLPPPPMIFGNAPERPEVQEERARDRRVRLILAKYGRQPRGLAWRI